MSTGQVAKVRILTVMAHTTYRLQPNQSYERPPKFLVYDFDGIETVHEGNRAGDLNIRRMLNAHKVVKVTYDHEKEIHHTLKSRWATEVGQIYYLYYLPQLQPEPYNLPDDLFTI